MPDAGEGLTEAEIVAWHVGVGDAVVVNQTIVEIETAKSIVDLPSPYTGVVTALHAAEGETVEVGVPIITIDVDPTGPAAVPAPDTSSSNPASSNPASSNPASSNSASSDTASSDPAPAATAPADTAGGAVLVGYGTSGAAATRRPRRVSSAAVVAPTGTTTAPSAPPASSATPATPAESSSASRVLAKPPVRKLARDLGVDLESIAPTGPGGIVTREDVLAKSAEGEARTLSTYPGDDQPWLASGKVSAGGRQTRVPVKSVRKRTAEAMVTSAFTAPHVTCFHTIDVTKMMKLVARLRTDKEFTGVRVTPLLITAKAMLLAVRRHPDINASWDDGAQEIVYKHYVNLGIAASTPRGLVVPNIKDAHRLGLKELAQEIATLTATARAGRTTPADMSDGTITITNVGVFGIDTGTPILNPGEAAILAFGAIREQPWVHHGRIKKRWVTQLALSFDHRLVDGALGALFLADVAAVLEDPSQALVWG
ncbi:dihydrolipoamide acetyltransferase family protein [Pengzhenrongella phosphoraccumulans]|uniref:dihydrolipoamide acetyltransferase family protein n=1 Tax=Pengzhenrongella phosphoraccumulans TaxID=3114394 RepID=UPI00388D57C8